LALPNRSAEKKKDLRVGKNERGPERKKKERGGQILA